MSKPDRLGRSVVGLSGLLAHTTKHGWSLVALDLKIDSTTYTGRTFLHVLAALAEWERDRLAERTSEGRAYARERYGHVPGRRRENPEELAARIVRERMRGRLWLRSLTASTLTVLRLLAGRPSSTRCGRRSGPGPCPRLVCVTFICARAWSANSHAGPLISPRQRQCHAALMAMCGPRVTSGCGVTAFISPPFALAVGWRRSVRAVT